MADELSEKFTSMVLYKIAITKLDEILLQFEALSKALYEFILQNRAMPFL